MPKHIRTRCFGSGRRVRLGFVPALFLGVAMSATVAGRAVAEEFPSRPIQFIVPFGAGGASDVLARLVARPVSRILKQPIVVENRVGGGGVVGMVALTRSPPDGYMIGLCGQNCATAQSLYSPAPFSPASFAAVTSLAELPLVLVSRKNLGADSMQALRELARKTPQGLTYGSPGTSTSNHLATVMLERIAGIDMVSVPYPSGAAVLTDVVAGRVDLYFDTVSSALPQIRSGGVKALAVTGTGRAPQLPEVPTMAEAGLAGLEASPRALLLAPAGTPPEVIEKLNAAFREALTTPEVASRIVDLGGKPIGDTAAEVTTYLKNDAERLGTIIRENKITVN